MNDKELNALMEDYIITKSKIYEDDTARISQLFPDDKCICLLIRDFLSDNETSEFKFTMIRIINYIIKKTNYVENGKIFKTAENVKIYIPILIKLLSKIKITEGYLYHPILPETEWNPFTDGLPESDKDADLILELIGLQLDAPPILDQFNDRIKLLESKKFKKYDIIFIKTITIKLEECYSIFLM